MTDVSIPEEETFPAKRRNVIAASVCLIVVTTLDANIKDGASVAGISFHAETWHLVLAILLWYFYSAVRYWQAFHDLSQKIHAPLGEEFERHIRQLAEFHAASQAMLAVHGDSTKKYSSYSDCDVRIKENGLVSFTITYDTIDQVTPDKVERRTNALQGVVPPAFVANWEKAYKHDLLVRSSHWTEYHFPKLFVAAAGLLSAVCLWIRLLS